MKTNLLPFKNWHAFRIACSPEITSRKTVAHAPAPKNVCFREIELIIRQFYAVTLTFSARNRELNNKKFPKMLFFPKIVYL
jgi:hypothetical protein